MAHEAKAEVGVSEASRAEQRVFGRSLASLTYVSGVSQSVTSLGGVRLLEEGKVGSRHHDFLTTPVNRLPMSTSPDSVLLSPFNRCTC